MKFVCLCPKQKVQEQICVGQVRLPGVHDIGEGPRSSTLYEATLVPICGLISQIPAEGFHAVELILLKHLYGNQLWSSLLSSDVWCFIGRFVNCMIQRIYCFNCHACSSCVIWSSLVLVCIHIAVKWYCGVALQYYIYNISVLFILWCATTIVLFIRGWCTYLSNVDFFHNITSFTYFFVFTCLYLILSPISESVPRSCALITWNIC